MEKPKEISGQLKFVVFSSEESGFFIGKLEPKPPIEGQKREITIKGNAINGIPSKGDNLNLQGEWISDPKYGEQFKFSVIMEDFEVSADGQQKFLINFVKGLGPATVSKLMEQFEDGLFDTIRNAPEDLYVVDGVSETLIENMVEALQKHGSDGEAMAVLAGYEITPLATKKLMEIYKTANAALQVIHENPYQLIDDIDGFGFNRTDKIAFKIGYDTTSIFRVAAGAIHILKEAAGRGHTFLPLRKLLFGSSKYERGMMELLGATVREEHMMDAIEYLENDKGEIFIERIEEENRFYIGMKYLHAAEREIERVTIDLAGKTRKEITTEISDSLNFDQREAVSRIFKDGVGIAVVTGGAGVGKTFVTQEIIRIAKENALTYQLLSPTGKAAKRLTIMTAALGGEGALTIHRYLRYNPHEGGFTLKTVTQDMLIIDETSMVDSWLMSELFKRVDTNRTRIIMLGDKNQLPPVGAGRPFQDIIESNFFPIFVLKKIMRTDDDSLIPINANKILDGDHQGVDFDGKQMTWESEKEAEVIPGEIVRIFLEENKYERENIQVLSPQRKGPIGTTILNEILQKALNPSGEELEKFKPFCIKDKVILVHNNYDAEYMNGDQGYVIGEDLKNSKRPVMLIEIIGEEKEKTVEVDREHFYDVELGYAITIHKSQGSEWEKIITPIHSAHSFMLSQNLIYTAITRGRYNVTMIGTHFGLKVACDKAGQAARFTWLSDLYKEYDSEGGEEGGKVA